MMDVGLADRLRYWLNPAGFQVIECDGWQSRGRTYAAYAPQGSVQHHTAGALPGDHPSLGIVINGRSDLPGPLAQVFGSRSLVAYVVAAGVANHAGPGGHAGLAGNQTVGGLEMEHDGGPDEPRTERLMDFCARVQCALITAPGSPVDPTKTCQHFEWSSQGKIDFFQWAGDDLRARVGKLLVSGPGVTPPAPPPPSGLVEGRWFGRHAPSDGAPDLDFRYGAPTDMPIVGDWSGLGLDGTGVVRGNRFLLADTPGGPAVHDFVYGDHGDHVIVGDWNGDGKAGVGVVRGNVFYLRNTLSPGNAEEVFAFGNPGDGVVVGHWRPGQRESVGVHRGNTLYLRNPDTGAADIVFAYGDPGDRVIMGDWNGDRVDTPAIVRDGRFFVRNSLTSGAADSTFGFGDPTDVPFACRSAGGGDGVLVAR